MILMLAEKLRLRRLELNLTQEEVAKRLNLTKQAIQKYESGTVTNLPLKRVEELAVVLQTTPAYLLGWDEEMLAIPKWNDEQAVENYNLFMSLPPEKKAEALHYLRYLAGLKADD